MCHVSLSNVICRIRRMAIASASINNALRSSARLVDNIETHAHRLVGRFKPAPMPTGSNGYSLSDAGGTFH